MAQTWSRTLARKNLKRFCQGADKVRMQALITFVDKVAEAFARVGREVPNDCQSDAVGLKLLEYVSGQTRLGVKKIRTDVFGVEDDFIETLKIQITRQIQALFGAIKDYRIRDYFCYRCAGDAMSFKSHVWLGQLVFPLK